jgi:hypothetical protein
MRLILTCAAALMLAATTASAAESAPPAFAKKPTATRDGDKVKVEFAADRETDVAVYVENAKGEIIRHLVAGVLGKNPPEPLKAGSLAQSVEWDLRDDDGKPAAGGPFKVRVGLGLKTSWGGLAFAGKDQTGPNHLESVMGLAAGPDGRVYVLDRVGAWLYWGSSKMHVFRRDGAYERTIKPFPANLPVERVKATGAFTNSFGGINPVSYRILGMTFYPNEDLNHQPAVTADGRIVLMTSGGCLAMIDAEGGTPEVACAGPTLGGLAGFPHLAAAPDGKAVYATGLAAGKNPRHAVYRARLPERGPAEIFFGEADKPGADNARLNDPRGLACDGKGQVLVADFGNNRVVALKEADKSFAGSFPVEAPSWVGVHPKTGAVYVCSKRTTVIKFNGWQDAKEQARADFAGLLGKIHENYRAGTNLCFALDASAEPAVLWAGCGHQLVRAEDQGAKFTDAVPAGYFNPAMQWRPTVDPTRRLVACRVGGMWDSRLHVLEEASGQVRILGGEVPGSEGRTHRLGPDGSIYGQDHGAPIIRYDRDGKPKPFPATLNDPGLKGRLPAGRTGTTAWERDSWVDRRGDIYVKAEGPEYHGLMKVDVYDQEGKFKRTAVWTVSDGMYGPRVDPKGNLYIMEAVKPQGEPFPNELAAHVRDKRGYDWIYGSIIKFGPEGGAVWFSGNQATPLTCDGWRASQTAYENSFPKIKNLRTTGGSLTGTIIGKGAVVSIPAGSLDAAAVKKFSFRLKNSTGGTKAALYYNLLGEAYGTLSKHKSIEIKPSSDFAEYTIDMSGEAGWKGQARGLTFGPAQDAASGEFALDWFRVGEGDKAQEWKFDTESGERLPATMKKEKAYGFNRPGDTLIQGALWWRPGFSPVGDMGTGGECHCTGSDFDVDDFGRTFAPDTGRFRVGVLDTNGNEILSFGGYGNQDFCGPESYVMDPAGKFLRPRQPTDPKDLKSPFANPEIGLAWIVGLAVTDRYAYVDDVINKRMLRVKLDYAATETVAAP